MLVVPTNKRICTMPKPLATTLSITRALEITDGSRLSAIVEAAYLRELATR
jgi:hypothetical protein